MNRRLVKRLRNGPFATTSMQYGNDLCNDAADEIERLQSVINELAPYADSLICYASTISEHDGNRVAKLLQDSVKDVHKAAQALLIAFVLSICTSAAFWEFLRLRASDEVSRPVLHESELRPPIKHWQERL